MGNQVSNWLYEKKDYAVKALTQWVGTVYTGDTTDEVISKLSTEKSVRVYGSTLFTDDGEFELIVRPFSRSIGADLGSKTGCMTFNVSVNHQASINGLYGAIDLDNVIYQVFIACGVIVDEDKLKHYNLAVRDRMGIGALRYYTGVVIKLDNGLLIGYVGKKIVQDIIDGMAAEGMLGSQAWTSDLPPANTTGLLVSELDASNGHSYEGLIHVVEHMKSVSGIGGDTLLADFVTYLNSQLTGINYDYITCYGFWTSNQIKINIMCWTISGDTFDTGSGDGVTYVNLVNGNTFHLVYYRQLFTYGFGWNYTNNPFPQTNQLNFIGAEKGYHSSTGELSWETYSNLNSHISYVPPQGISFESGAVIPTPDSHIISTVYPDWKTSSNQTISPAKNFSSRALIALSFTGDTQYNTQAGVITTNEMLQRLGVNVEATEEYIPIGGEEGEDEPVIRPDPSPTPNDSPTDEYPDSDTPASKYMISVWNMTDAMVQSFAGALWSNTVWNAIKDFFTKPTDAVIAMFTLYGVDVGDGVSSQEIKLGGHGTGVNAIPVTTRFKTVDLGNAIVPEFYANVEDYAPYSSAEIFLPFIGYVKVDVNEIMNSTVNIKYVFDMWTGSLVARIFVTRDGVKQELYNFNGSSAVQIPLTDRDYTNALSSLLSGALETARNVAVAAGITAATGGSALVPVLTGVAGGLSTMGNHAQGIKNRVVRSGSLGSIYGAMANKTACIYIKRPVAYNANNYQHYYGFPANWTCTLRECNGFTRVKDIHLDTVTCTDEERVEIEQLLKKGVML